MHQRHSLTEALQDTDRFQSNRLLIILKNASTDNEKVKEFAAQYGCITKVHRPSNKPQLVFVQYEEENIDNILKAIKGLRTCSLFYAVDHALEPDRRPNYHGERKPAAEGEEEDGTFSCETCTKEAQFRCKCGVYYCKIKCQLKDWPKHKNFCVPSLIPVTTSAQRDTNENVIQREPKEKEAQLTCEELPQRNPKENEVQIKATHPRILQSGEFPQTTACVKISAWFPSGELFIYEVSPQRLQEYQALEKRLYRAAVRAKPLTAIPCVDDIIFAPFQGKHYRAKILCVGEENVQVQYVEFGNTADVFWKHCRQFDEDELKYFPYHTFPVMLEGVDKFTDEQQKTLRDVEESRTFSLTAIYTEPGRETRRVVLTFPNKALTLNMHLTMLNKKAPEHKSDTQIEKKQTQEGTDIVQEIQPTEEASQTVQKNLQQTNEILLEKQSIMDENEIPTKNEQSVSSGEVTEIEERECPSEGENADDEYKPLFSDDVMEIKSIESNTMVKLRIIDASEALETEIISVIETKYTEDYNKVLKDCATYGEADPNLYRPTMEGEVCLVLHEQKWCRAIFDKSDRKYMLLDVGTIVGVPCENIRRFPPGLSRIVYNNEVIVQNMLLLKVKMTDGKPENCHGLTIDAIVKQNCQGDIMIQILD